MPLTDQEKVQAIVAQDGSTLSPLDRLGPQLSRSDTPRLFDGRTRPDDYVGRLQDPLLRMQLFEEMRASDTAVDTALSAREQMILGANWALNAPDDSDAAREIHEFCEDNLYPVLDQLLFQLAGALQYGVGIVEPVLDFSDRPFAAAVTRGKVQRATKAGARRLYLRRLAHVRQRSVWSFVISDTGELLMVEQQVFTGGIYRRIPIPPDKLLLWVYRQQGDDYWGYPPTRNCYKAWEFKRQLEAIHVLHADRFGAGTPTVVAGPDWQDGEYTKAESFLKAWRAAGNNYLIAPPGGQIALVESKGTMSAALLEWVKYYGLSIAKTMLTQGTELGTTETGSRALGDNFTEQIEGVAQADCESLAALLNTRLIPMLVDANFGPQGAYPYFQPSQRVRRSPQVAAMVAQIKAGGLVAWSAKDEQWLRDAMEMPSIDVDQRQREMDQAKADMAAVRAAPPAPSAGAVPPPAPPSGGETASGDPASGEPEAATAREMSRARGGAGWSGGAVGPHVARALSHAGQAPETIPEPDPAAPGTTYRTPAFAAWEMATVKPDLLARDLDLQGARLTADAQDVFRRIDASLADQVAQLAAQGPDALAAGAQDITVPAALRRSLRQVLATAAAKAETYGHDAVVAEVARQAQPAGVGPQRRQQLAARVTGWLRALAQATDPTPDDAAAQRQRDLDRLLLAAMLDQALAAEVQRRIAAAVQAALTALAQAATAAARATAGSGAAPALETVARTAATSALEELSAARTQQTMGAVVHRAFVTGRRAAAQQLAARGAIRSKIYSAVMDGATCAECARWDGAEFPLDYPEDVTGVAAPNPRCLGGFDRCRCIWEYIGTDESIPDVGPSKGSETYPPPGAGANPLEEAA